MTFLYLCVELMITMKEYILFKAMTPITIGVNSDSLKLTRHKQIAIVEPFDDSCMQSDSRTYGLTWTLQQLETMSYPPLTLFAHHTHGPSTLGMGGVCARSDQPEVLTQAPAVSHHHHGHHHCQHLPYLSEPVS